MSVNNSYCVTPTLGERTAPSLNLKCLDKTTKCSDRSNVLSRFLARHSPNELLETFSLIFFFSLMMSDGHYCSSLYLVPGPAALLAARNEQIYNPLRCPAALESQWHFAPPQAANADPNTSTFLGKPLWCVRDPQPCTFLWVWSLVTMAFQPISKTCSWT